MANDEREIDQLLSRYDCLEKSFHENMQAQAYSNGQMKETLKNMANDLKEVLEQTRKTNGRVTALEHFKIQIRSSAAAVSFIVSVIVAAIGLLIRVV